jgi:L-fuconolactonase
VTLNHLGLPFPDVDRDTWRAAMRAFARRPSLYVQLSGLPFLHGERWREADAQSLLAEALAIFGPERLMFASDWPMLLRFASYGDWVAAVERYLEARQASPHEARAVFAGTALRANPRLRVRREAASPTTRPREPAYAPSSSTGPGENP